MTTLRTAAQQALEALELLQNAIYNIGGEHVTGLGYANDAADSAEKTITTLKATLAEPVQEPTRMPPFPPVSLWKRGCAVCGIGAGGHAYGCVCPRMDCPTRVTCGGTL